MFILDKLISPCITLTLLAFPVMKTFHKLLILALLTSYLNTSILHSPLNNL